MSRYRTLARQLREWADDKGYVYLDQFTATGMDAFYASWKGGKSSRGKKLERARRFWNFCKKRIQPQNTGSGTLRLTPLSIVSAVALQVRGDSHRHTAFIRY